MPLVAVPGARFDVDLVVFDKDGTLIDLHASWGPPARAWLDAVADGDGQLVGALAERLGFDLAVDQLVADGVFAAGTLAQIGTETLHVLTSEGWDDVRISTAITRARAAVSVVIDATPPVTLADLPTLF